MKSPVNPTPHKAPISRVRVRLVRGLGLGLGLMRGTARPTIVLTLTPILVCYSGGGVCHSRSYHYVDSPLLDWHTPGNQSLGTGNRDMLGVR